ncbi:hypothetical protein J1N35_011552 [Gossypium stocksii]|uniref:Uncharacterized protein n=1 Tax=Gossypium stocksii TaxID=47602 RepID=A0A9D3W285_9ROSI|nr:hypothetical protein J1N35_011552 [Gossypium stocksii]
MSNNKVKGQANPSKIERDHPRLRYQGPRCAHDRKRKSSFTFLFSRKSRNRILVQFYCFGQFQESRKSRYQILEILVKETKSCSQGALDFMSELEQANFGSKRITRLSS